MAADLSRIVRERVMLATVADAIVAAAAGKSLHVAVECPDSQVAFVGHLTRALHARGRACRYGAAQPSPSGTTRRASSGDGAGDPTVMVITSGRGDGEEYHVSIRVTAGTPMTPGTEGVPWRGSGGHADADHGPDIVLDYHDPSGPKIRHIGPRLAPPLRTPR